MGRHCVARHLATTFHGSAGREQLPIRDCRRTGNPLALAMRKNPHFLILLASALMGSLHAASLEIAAVRERMEGSVDPL